MAALRGHIVLRTHVNHNFQAMIVLQVLRFCSSDASAVIGQPDDGRRRNQLWREEDPRHLLRMARERQRR